MGIIDELRRRPPQKEYLLTHGRSFVASTFFDIVHPRLLDLFLVHGPLTGQQHLE